MSATSGTTQDAPVSGWHAGRIIHRLRVWSGLVLFAYVTGHFANHALGLISLEFMGKAAGFWQAFWRFPPINILLYVALTTHVLTALWKVYQRRTLRMQRQEWVQLISGLAIPLLLVVHVTGTRGAAAMYGLNDSYAYVLYSTFVASPFSGVLNAAGLVAAWVHGCIGVHYWLRFKSVYTATFQAVALVCAALLPALSLTGYLSAGRTILPLANDGEWLEVYYRNLNLADDAVWEMLARDIEVNRFIIIGVISAVILARMLRNFAHKRSRNLTIRYVDGPDIRQPRGATLLEISRANELPHASVCGGRGRCSTCRVRILESEEPPEPPEPDEQRVLQRINAPDDVRLACQLVPRSNMRVVRLLPPDTNVSMSSNAEQHASGREQLITVVFADLRGFTTAAESRLPFDVVYLINQFARSMGDATTRNGGIVDKFLGDGVMALFGVKGTEEDQARQALGAAADMMHEIDVLNSRLLSELPEKFRIGIGIHTGSVILGEIGVGTVRGLTAIGDTVNTASRLEAATKTLNCTLCVSAQTLEHADLHSQASQQTITVPGKTATIEVHTFMNEEDLRSLLSASALV